MTSIIRTLFLLLMLHTVVNIGYSQDKKSSEVLHPAGIDQGSVVMRPGKPIMTGEDKELTEEKKIAEGVKILILGDSYQPDSKSWMLLSKMNFRDQTEFLKAILYANDKARKSAIDDASREVYGAEATPPDFAYWDATIIKEKKDWYSTMVLANSSKLNADKNKKDLCIRIAYVTVFGREATATELAKWMSGTAHYRVIYQSLISYMYSAEGAADLTATVERTFTRKKQMFTDEQVKQRMMVAKAQKMDFMKMVNSF